MKRAYQKKEKKHALSVIENNNYYIDKQVVPVTKPKFGFLRYREKDIFKFAATACTSSESEWPGGAKI